MNRGKSPRVASWLLEHLVPQSQRDQALPGDLLEELNRGRTLGWYWCQVLAAVLISWAIVVHKQKMTFLFAILWSVPFPMLLFYATSAKWFDVFLSHTIRFPWPYSALSELTLELLAASLYVWSGAALYVVTYAYLASRTLTLRGLCRAFVIAILVLLGACFGTAEIVSLTNFSLATYIDRRTFTAMQSITNPRLFLERVPIILSALFAIRAMLPDAKNGAPRPVS